MKKLELASQEFLRRLFQERLPAGCSVYLFGSRARGDATWNSDFDFWIDPTVDRKILVEIEEILEESFVPYHVDLVTTDQLKGEFGRQVRAEARRWN